METIEMLSGKQLWLLEQENKTKNCEESYEGNW